MAIASLAVTRGRTGSAFDALVLGRLWPGGVYEDTSSRDYLDVCEIDGTVYVSNRYDTSTPLRSISSYTVTLVGQNHGASLFEATPTFANVLTPTDMGDVTVPVLHPAGYAVAQVVGGGTQLWQCSGGVWSIVALGRIGSPAEILVTDDDVFVIEDLAAGLDAYRMRGGCLTAMPAAGRPPELLRYLKCMEATQSRPILWRDAYWAADTSADGGLWAEWERAEGYDPTTLETLARIGYPEYEDEQTRYPDVASVAVRTLSGLHCFRPMGWYNEWRATTIDDTGPTTHLYWIHLTNTRGYVDTIDETGGEPTPWITRGRGSGNEAWLTGRDEWVNFSGTTPTATNLYRLLSMVTVDRVWELCIDYSDMTAGNAHLVVTATGEDGTVYTLYDGYVTIEDDSSFCVELTFPDEAEEGVYTIDVTLTDSDGNEATDSFDVYLLPDCGEDTTVTIDLTPQNQPQGETEIGGDRVLWLVDNDDERIATALRVVTDWGPADEATGLRGLVRCDREDEAVDAWGTYQPFAIGASVEIEQPGNYVRVGIIGSSLRTRPRVAMQLRRESLEYSG